MRLKKDVSPDGEIEREKPSPIKSHLYISGGKKKKTLSEFRKAISSINIGRVFFS